MTTHAEASTCRECGSHLSATWRRVFSGNDGDPGLCRDCESRTHRFGTADAIGADLDALRTTDTPTYADGHAPEDHPTTTYTGRAACRFCRHRFDRGRAALVHLLDAHPERVLADYRGREAPDHA